MKQHLKVKQLCQLALLFALAVVLSFLENLIPPLVVAVPGIKLGLSNIVVMYCLFYLGTGYSGILLLLKSGFALLTRGVTAAFLGACGGICSLLIMLLLAKVFHCSSFFTSCFGGVFHNIGQLLGASILLNQVVWAYTPVLVISGVIMGIITGKLLQVVLPILHRQVLSSNTKK